MNYQETLNWMFSQLPMYQRQGKTAFKKDLTNSLALTEYLGHPHQKFKSVHVAGTNGKGSTSHMIASVLMEAGYKVGLYTSPHLKDFRERIRINGEVISEQEVIHFINTQKSFFIDHSVSFFEMTVGMAFDCFAKHSVDIAIVEVGLGGRLDSTNIILPEISVITNIGLDHTQFLGETLPEIAVEKAGIIKENVPVVVGEYQEEVHAVFERIAKEKDTTISIASELVQKEYETDLKGFYQKLNVKAAVQAVIELNKKGYSVSDADITKGLNTVAKNTGLLGRWQTLHQSPKVICDTGHNKEGLSIVLDQLSKESFKELHFILGVVNDKDLGTVLPMFPKKARYYFCRPDIPRGLDAGKLAVEATKYDLNGAIFQSVQHAYEHALENAAKDDLIFIGGSTFVVAEVL